jgi:hypothetical protein
MLVMSCVTSLRRTLVTVLQVCETCVSDGVRRALVPVLQV